VHTLTTIGYLGSKRAYLDLPLDECIRRWKLHEDTTEEPEARLVDTFEFVDEFYTYEAGQ